MRRPYLFTALVAILALLAPAAPAQAEYGQDKFEVAFNCSKDGAKAKVSHTSAEKTPSQPPQGPDPTHENPLTTILTILSTVYMLTSLAFAFVKWLQRRRERKL